MPAVVMDYDAQRRLEMLTNTEKLRAFFQDPEKSIRIFLSSYARQMGLIWCVLSSLASQYVLIKMIQVRPQP